MDWGKAKTILIVSLIITNLVLLAALYLSNMKIAIEDEDMLLEILAAGNIVIDSKIPDKPEKMAALYVKSEVVQPLDLKRMVNGLLVYENLGTDKDDEEAMVIFADELLARAGYKDEYTFFSHIEKKESGWIVIYRDIFHGTPIEESYVRLHISNGGCDSIERKWYKPISLHINKKEIKSPLKAMIQLLAEKDEEEILIITDIELVYWANTHAISSLPTQNEMAIPAWRITDNTGNTRYIEGY